MVNSKLVGLLKFFRKEERLDQLLDGLLYCNTPETYRLSGMEGIGDPNESCVHSYRESRGDVQATFEIDGHALEGLTAVTLHMGERKDMWLHCWFALDMPTNNDELVMLVDDLNRVRKAFGSHYAFLPHGNLTEFVNRVRLLYDGDFDRGRVLYSDDNKKWSVGCKSNTYSYQREYRFGFGQCPHTSTKALPLTYDAGFSDLIMKNPSIRATDTETQNVWFHLDRNDCYCNLDS